MWHDTDISRRLGIRYPIIQGPFGGGLSSVDLLSAVSNAGGLGSFGAHHLPPERFQTLAEEVRAKTDKPFAINLWVSDHDPGGMEATQEAHDGYLKLFAPFYSELGIDPPPRPEHYGQRYDDQIDALLAIAPPVFSFVFGIPSRTVLEECRRKRIITIGAATTPDEAAAIEEAGVDIVLATGFEAGGHRVSFLKPAEESLYGTLALVPRVVDKVRIPVIATGGIADGRGIAAALTLGAKGVQIGTAFLACKESNASAFHKETLFSERAHHTVLSRAYTGRLARFIPDRLISSWQGPTLPFPMQSWFTAPLKKAAAAQGKDFCAGLYAGQGAPLLRQHTAQGLMTALVAETERLF